jgi:hypothetical protein
MRRTAAEIEREFIVHLILFIMSSALTMTVESFMGLKVHLTYTSRSSTTVVIRPNEKSWL